MKIIETRVIQGRKHLVVEENGKRARLLVKQPGAGCPKGHGFRSMRPKPKTKVHP